MDSGERGAGVSLLSVAALIVFMPADRVGECARHFFRRLVFTGWVSGEKGLPAALILSYGILSMHASGSRRRARGTLCFAPPAAKYFLSAGGRGVGGSLLSATALLVCMLKGKEGERARRGVFFFLSPSYFHEPGGGGGEDKCGSLLLMVRLIYMPAGRESERAGRIFFCASAVHFLRNR